jgi:putative transposase
MPVSKKKRITSPLNPSKPEPSSSVLPEQQVFHQYLRRLAQSAVRIVLETVMREELDQFIGADWGASSPKRKGHRNGYYTRDLVTSTGRLEDINVPRDRAGQFHTQAFERYSRYEPHIADGLSQMFVAGTSTHKVGEVAQTLLGVAPSASTISRLNQTLTQQFEAWRERPRPRALAYPVLGRHSFQHSSWRQD